MLIFLLTPINRNSTCMGAPILVFIDPLFAIITLVWKPPIIFCSSDYHPWPRGFFTAVVFHSRICRPIRRAIFGVLEH